MQGVRKKGHLWYLLCNSQPNCTKNCYLSVKQLTTSIVPWSKISFLSLIFSTMYYTRCHKVLETIKHFSCPWKWKLQPCCFVFKTEHVYCCLDDFSCDSKFELISNNIFSYMKKCLKWKIVGLFHLLGMRSSRGGRKVLETRIYSTV